MVILAVELATAYVSLIPSMQGAQGAIAAQLTPAATAAGSTAGAAGGAAMGTTMRTTLMRYLGPAALFAGVAVAAKGLYGIGETWKDVTNTVRTGTGAQGEALDGLVDSVKNVAKTVPAEIGDVGTAIADLNTRLGLTGPVLETVASQYLEAGRILGEDVDIAKTTAAFNAFKIEGDDVVGAMDHLFQVSQATGIGMNELAASVQSNAPAVKDLGLSFEETAALVGSLDKAGLNSSKMMAGMSRGLIELAKDGEDPADAFARLTAEMGDLIESGDKAAAIDLASGIFGTRNASQFVGAVESGTLALDDLVGATGATADTILGVGEETQDFAEKWQIVKNNASAALEPLGSKVFDALGDALQSAMPYFNAFADWLGENEWALGVIVGLIGVALVGAFVALVAPIWATTVALLANPITWIVVGIMALIAGLVLLIANWDKVVAWISDVWAGAVQWVKDLFASIGDWFTTKGEEIAAFLSGLWTSIKSTAEGVWTGIVNWIKGVPQKILDFFLNWTLPGLLIKHWDSIKEGATRGFNAVVDFVKGIPGKIVNALGNVGTLLLDAGKRIMAGFLRGITDKFDDVKNFVTGIGSWIADHKGPKAYDLALLRPAGGWIMDGLRAGIEEEIPALKSTLNRVSGAIAVSAPAAAASYGLPESGGRAGPAVHQTNHIYGMTKGEVERLTGARLELAMVGA